MNKRIISALIISATAILSFASCKNSVSDPTTAGGKPYELILSIDQQLWDGEVGDTLRSIFMEPVPMLNQVEPMYDMMRIVPSGLKGIMLQHRNILIVKVTDEVSKPVSAAQYDSWAKPQIVMTVAAPDAKSLAGYLTENRVELQTVFEIAERDRAIANAKRYGERILQDDVYEVSGMRVNIPKGYKRRVKQDDFIWISNEHAYASQGFVVYTYPYSGKDDFRQENILKRRNEFIGRIPGPSAGSYATTSEYFEPETSYVRTQGRQWAVMRGLWDVDGDFMGGPFVNYSTLDTQNNRVIAIDCFVYSPKDHKRNYLKQLEHIANSAQFDK